MEKWQYPFLILATKNENKRKQIEAIVHSELGIGVKSLNDFPHSPDVVEDQETFEGNARKKAEEISKLLNGPVIADDSGLVVHALGGSPGVYSARYAGDECDDDRNNLKLMKEIASVPEESRQATFVSVMAIAAPGEETHVVRGEIDGMILSELRGEGGFGYQPLFHLPSEGKTMAELTNKRRNEIGHRALATRKVIGFLKERYRFK